MDRNLHYVDHQPSVEKYEDPTPTPTPTPTPAPAPAPAPTKNNRKMMLYILLVAAILGLIYGLYCLFKQMKGKEAKYAASTRYYYF